MPSKILDKPKIELTKIDRLAFDPEKGCFRGALDDLDRWTKLYFDGEATSLVIALPIGGMLHQGLKSLQVLPSGERAKLTK